MADPVISTDDRVQEWQKIVPLRSVPKLVLERAKSIFYGASEYPSTAENRETITKLITNEGMIGVWEYFGNKSNAVIFFDNAYEASLENFKEFSDAYRKREDLIKDICSKIGKLLPKMKKLNQLYYQYDNIQDELCWMEFIGEFSNDCERPSRAAGLLENYKNNIQKYKPKLPEVITSSRKRITHTDYMRNLYLKLKWLNIEDFSKFYGHIISTTNVLFDAAMNEENFKKAIIVPNKIAKEWEPVN